MKGLSEKDCLLEKVEWAPDGGCWLWTGYTLQNGYGQMSVKRSGQWRTRLAHRVSYELHKGDVPEGMQIDHLCRVRRCVNPEHLELVTQKENMRRGECRWARTHRTGMCARGLHALTPGTGTCRKCKQERKRIGRGMAALIAETKR